MSMHPAASPSSPSVMLAAFDVPTTTSHSKATKHDDADEPSVAERRCCAFLKNGG